jgi:hypothetical protein
VCFPPLILCSCVVFFISFFFFFFAKGLFAERYLSLAASNAMQKPCVGSRRPESCLPVQIEPINDKTQGRRKKEAVALRFAFPAKEANFNRPARQATSMEAKTLPNITSASSGENSLRNRLRCTSSPRWRVTLQDSNPGRSNFATRAPAIWTPGRVHEGLK